jgi:hypothetical protein
MLLEMKIERKKRRELRKKETLTSTDRQSPAVSPSPTNANHPLELDDGSTANAPWPFGSSTHASHNNGFCLALYPVLRLRCCRRCWSSSSSTPSPSGGAAAISSNSRINMRRARLRRVTVAHPARRRMTRAKRTRKAKR